MVRFIKDHWSVMVLIAGSLFWSYLVILQDKYSLASTSQAHISTIQME